MNRPDAADWIAGELKRRMDKRNPGRNGERFSDPIVGQALARGRHAFW